MLCLIGTLRKMDKVKLLSKKRHLTKEKQNTLISKKLNNEIKTTQKMLNAIYKKRYHRKKSFTKVQACDFIAEQYRIRRYKIQNEFK